MITAVDQMLVVREPETGRVDYSHVMGSVVNVVREYDAVYGELSEITVETSEPVPTFELSYAERDLLGRTAKMVETSRPSWNTTITAESHYTYDARGRLKTVKKRPDDASPWDEQFTYTYDANGNRTKVETVTPTETTITNATYATDDALLCTSDGTTRTTYFYSARGSLASKVEMTTSADCAANPPPTCADNACAETTYGYDAMGNLTAVVLPDDTFIEYQSDAAGRRVAKRINGVVVARWLWDGQLGPIAELAPDGSMTSVFVYADGVNSPDYMVRGGLEYTFVKDALGSVRQVLDSNGVVMQAVSYDAWGVPTATVGSLDYQPFGFAGGLWDVDTGLVRFGARDYDPEVGRWTAKDPIRFGGGDVALYAYSSSDPVNAIDPLGTTTVAIGAGYGASVGGVAGPPGAVVGAILGGVIGGVAGWWAGSLLRDVVFNNSYEGDRTVKRLDENISKIDSTCPSGSPDPNDPDHDPVNHWKSEVKAFIKNLKQIRKKTPKNRAKREPLDTAIQRGEDALRRWGD